MLVEPDALRKVHSIFPSNMMNTRRRGTFHPRRLDGKRLLLMLQESNLESPAHDGQLSLLSSFLVSK